MTREDLKDVGPLLFGSLWQTDLAKSLGVSDRTVRRWVAKDSPIPPNVWLEIASLCEERAGYLTEWAVFLKKESGK